MNEIDEIIKYREAKNATWDLLEQGFKRSRMEIGGMAIREIAQVIKENMHPFDVRSLSEELKTLKK